MIEVDFPEDCVFPVPMDEDSEEEDTKEDLM